MSFFFFILVGGLIGGIYIASTSVVGWLGWIMIASSVFGLASLAIWSFSQTVAAAASKEQANFKRCPHCAEEIRAAAIKCKHCGEAVA